MTRRTAYVMFAAVLCLAAVVAIFLLISEESGGFAEDLAFTALALLVHGLTIGAGIAIVDRAQLRWLGLLCVAVGIAGFGVGAALGWATPGDEEPAKGLLKAAGALAAFSLALAQVAIMTAHRETAEGRLVAACRGLAAVTALGLAALLAVAIVDEIGDERFFRWVGVVTVMWVVATTLVPVARRLQLPPGAQRS